ncbi:hypothetical protein SAMN05421780_101382 [Flexibacter flexilis DSM 6793]|uniref:Copper-binding protein MbnP-like domain-containing protein n=2 Tax=Flexibacter flexilis TaxID=998 RepID=A0A1I1DPM2_9BACT|nr:hypothetical protein SAMN05421780_101382 [Flexibacter flexilis DSM 6793]
MRFFFSSLGLLIVFLANAQDVTKLKIIPKFKTDKLVLHKTYCIGKDSLTITNLKFYITDLQYFKNDSLVGSSSKKAYLIDAFETISQEIIESKLFDFNKIKFKLGIDSLTNVAGVLDGNLDPIHGMYWTWQSGYINFKLEGIADNCPARNHKFYWHIGGYLEPFYAMREIELNCNARNSAEIFIQIDQLFTLIDVSKIYQVMSPSEKSVQIANQFPEIFKMTQE